MVNPDPAWAELTSGVIIRNPARPDWGLGQVQSVIGGMVTANFEEVGKVTVNAAVVALDVVDSTDATGHLS